MTEPRRWLDDRQLSGELRKVLEAASPPPPLAPGLDAQLSAYAAGLASQTLLAKVGGATLWRKLWLTAGSSSKSLVLVSFLGTIALGVYTAAPVPKTSEHGREPSAAVSAPRAEATVAATPSEPVVAERAAALNAVSTAVREAPNAPPSALASSAQPSIVEEAKLLESARSFLIDSPALALELTAQHQRLYPAGQLSAEREFVAIEALLRLGRRQEAERR